MQGKLVAASALLASAGAAAIYFYKKKRALRLNLQDKQGNAVVVRLAVPEDREQVKESIADKTGTGSGTGNDDFLLQEYDRMVKDTQNITVLFVDDAKSGKGLGMMAVIWSSPTESYWQSLRVAEAARTRGIAKLLFQVAAQLAVDRQGPESVSRWGVVSGNKIMTNWSERLRLKGPEAFRRHGAPANPAVPPLPAGYVLRKATLADVPAIMSRIASFPVAQSKFGTQNFVLHGWAAYNEAMLKAAISRAPSRGVPVPEPRLLYNTKGELIAFVNLAMIRFGPTWFLNQRYMDGTEGDGYEVLLHQLPALAAEYKCDAVGGYVPTLPWVLDTFERSPVFKRQTDTEQWEFHWKNVEHI